jgi:hemerythrin superfamily protein
MKATSLLRADHKQVKALFAELKAAGDSAYKKKRTVADQIFAALEVHTRIEEELFYPAVQAASKSLGKDVEESLEEHHVVKLLIAELRELPPEEEQYDAKFAVLMENVEHHIEEEEEEMFPQAEERLAKELDRLGDDMALKKEQLGRTHAA